ncbi:MAG: formylglycine-generating enzyme family protein [Nitrospirota bacterium]|nr:formylglycine-generating enzyme family protein [Nitrospirota bacterium]
MVTVPAGPFVQGSDTVDKEGLAREFGGRRPWYLDEHPRRRVELPTFRIDRTEVSEADYQKFVAAIPYPPPPHWKDETPTPDHPDLPVTRVSWMDAQNFCHWRSARLPTEAEWEKAARGAAGWVYPWGNDFDPKRANTGQLGSLAPAGHFAESVSPYGALDMAGNVWEWTASWYLPYPGNTTPFDDYGHRYKVVRGGSHGGQGHYRLEELTSRASYRFYLDPREKQPDVGFRCVQRLGNDGQPVDDAEIALHQ